jgi:hypothetical protein
MRRSSVYLSRLFGSLLLLECDDSRCYELD